MKTLKTLKAAALLGAMTLVGAVQAAGVSGQGTWETTLKARDLDGITANGPEAYYDTALNITWFINAGGAALPWSQANDWAANYVILYGITGWRLPKMVDLAEAGCNFEYSGSDCGYNVSTANAELAHMYYVTLGNKASVAPNGSNQAGAGLVNTGPFNNLSKGYYWYGTGSYDAADPTGQVVAERAFFFINELTFTYDDGYTELKAGQQGTVGIGRSAFVWLVHDGDVTAAVPEPQSYALMLAGLGLMGFAARRRSSNKQQ
ncbi:PEP-CTERM sorting domain-containing protein [Paucibacter sp. TC2R-5]|uniref:PEP-CTERM sorting domain-containing protein n=1 Tax=Paucibacter sp. TC2R-5 TaxID=2893555 RepID=UPI0021E4915C|nr:PEP-CTERM sorting domain-containing protein [Paucibacter sp. TC2R-5]MCV2360002.1 PEP-CTERM sorting domain-containing protein [Paucibacter sp. TC2R-5]